MSRIVREFHRRDREQLTALVNLHVSSVLPGVALSTNVVLSQLEREPGERIVDPWVDHRCCLAAIEDDALVVAPGAAGAGADLLDAVVERARSWEPIRIYADGALPAPGCYGSSDSWPHIRQLLVAGGFDGPTRRELVVAARCRDLLGHHIDGAEIRRSVGVLGTRLDLGAGDQHLGYIEVGEIDPSLVRSESATTWTDVGNLFATQPATVDSVMPALFSAAAEWLLLGGVERIIDYYADDVHPPEYLAALHRLGFTPLSTNERGWTLSG
jgi:GNAT superfamily N-acetyltransferase